MLKVISEAFYDGKNNDIDLQNDDDDRQDDNDDAGYKHVDIL